MVKKNLRNLVLTAGLLVAGCSSVPQKGTFVMLNAYNGNKFIATRLNDGRYFVDSNKNSIEDTLEVAEYVWKNGEKATLNGREARTIKGTLLLDKDLVLIPVRDPLTRQNKENTYWRLDFNFLGDITVVKTNKGYGIETTLNQMSSGGELSKCLSVLKGDTNGAFDGLDINEWNTPMKPDELYKQWALMMYGFMNALQIDK